MIAVLAIAILFLPSQQVSSETDRTEDALTKEWERINSRIGPDKWETAIALGNLARFYRDQKRFPEAVPFYEQALAIAKTQHREATPLAVAFTTELAKIYRALNRPVDAERLEKPVESASRTVEPGARKMNPKDGLLYVWVPPGEFIMGCSPGDTECDPPERPAHAATLRKGFWMGQTAVTVGAYKRFSQTTGQPMPPEKSADRFLNARAGNDELPVVAVTRDQASSYCSWAAMRLPSEAEWEFAARGGTTGARYGNLDEIASYADNSGQSRIDSTALWNDQKSYALKLLVNGNGARPVAQKIPNAYGLYDMLGNVWQWTADWYSEKYYQVSDKQDPVGPPGGTTGTLRGGSWGATPRAVRVSSRANIAPNQSGDKVGFRCAGDGAGLVEATVALPNQPRTYEPRAQNETQSNMKISVRKLDRPGKYVFEVSFIAPTASDQVHIYEFRVLAGVHSSDRQIQTITGKWNAGDRIALSTELSKDLADASQGWDLRFCVGTAAQCFPSPNLLF